MANQSNNDALYVLAPIAVGLFVAGFMAAKGQYAYAVIALFLSFFASVFLANSNKGDQ